MIQFSKFQNSIISKIISLKKHSGTHSPSMITLLKEIPELKLKVDACFLSNPYATDLFIEYFQREIIDCKRFRDLAEYYPSQNKIISKYIASRYKMDDKYFFVTNGAIEGIQAIIHNFSRNKILINIPTFSSYYEYAKPNQEIIYNHLSKDDNFALDVEKYYNQVQKYQPDTVVLINPNNPDGHYIKRNDIKWLLNKLKDVSTVIIDESFIHFASEGKETDVPSAIRYVEQKKNLVIIKSMSKDFGVAGLRLGFIAMHPERVKKLSSNGYLWNISGIGEYFFELYSRDDFWSTYDQVRKKYIIETEKFYLNLSQISWIKTYPSKANFILIELLNGVTADDVMYKLLIEYGIYVRNCNDKIGLEGEFIRVASRKKEDNEYILESIRQIGSNL